MMRRARFYLALPLSLARGGLAWIFYLAGELAWTVGRVRFLGFNSRMILLSDKIQGRGRFGPWGREGEAS